MAVTASGHFAETPTVASDTEPSRRMPPSSMFHMTNSYPASGSAVKYAGRAPSWLTVAVTVAAAAPAPTRTLPPVVAAPSMATVRFPDASKA